MIMQMNMCNCVIQNMTVNNSTQLYTNYRTFVLNVTSAPDVLHVNAVSNQAGSKLILYEGQNPTLWNFIQETENGYVFQLNGTNLLLTTPSEDSRFLTLQPRGGLGNAQQYFIPEFTSQTDFYIKTQGGVYVSTETQTPTVGTFLVLPVTGQPAFRQLFGTFD